MTETPEPTEKGGFKITPSMLGTVVVSLLGAGGAGSLAVSTTNLSSDMASLKTQVGTLTESVKELRADMKDIDKRLPRDGEYEKQVRAIVREMVRPEALR